MNPENRAPDLVRRGPSTPWLGSLPVRLGGLFYNGSDACSHVRAEHTASLTKVKGLVSRVSCIRSEERESRPAATALYSMRNVGGADRNPTSTIGPQCRGHERLGAISMSAFRCVERRGKQTRPLPWRIQDTVSTSVKSYVDVSSLNDRGMALTVSLGGANDR